MLIFCYSEPEKSNFQQQIPIHNRQQQMAMPPCVTKQINENESKEFAT